MSTYTVRPGFTVTTDTGSFTGGQSVELNEAQFTANKHKLEGIERDADLDIVIGNGGGSSGEDEYCYPEPYVTGISPKALLLNTSGKLNVTGSFFTPDTTVEVEGATVNAVEFVNSHRLTVNLTVGDTERISNVILNNGKELIIENAISLFFSEATFVDLRAGGTDFSSSAIETVDGLSFTRTAGGIQTSGVEAFSAWMRFVGDNDAWVWSRSEKKTLSWIFSNTSSFMVGIGSRAIDPDSTQPFYQAEIMSYFSSTVDFSGFFGNRGNPGQGVNDSKEASFSNESGIKKVVFENNGEPGGAISFYDLPDANLASWLDTSNLRGSFTTINNFTADEERIMPFAIPRTGGGSLLLGFVIE